MIVSWISIIRRFTCFFSHTPVPLCLLSDLCTYVPFLVRGKLHSRPGIRTRTYLSSSHQRILNKHWSAWGEAITFGSMLQELYHQKQQAAFIDVCVCAELPKEYIMEWVSAWICVAFLWSVLFLVNLRHIRFL